MTSLLQPPSFESRLRHTAWFYEDTRTAVQELADVVARDAEAGVAVALSLPERLTAPLLDAVSPAQLHLLADGGRASRPVDAMDHLWRFTREALEAGAPQVHSISQIPLDGGLGDRQWYRYERAINAVFAKVPLVATCLFDARRVPPDVHACVTGSHLESIGGLADQACGHDDCATPTPVELPDRQPELSFVSSSPRAARQAVSRATASLDPSLVERVAFVVSETVTNAVLHGSGSAHIRCWISDATVHLAVEDDGPGFIDPFLGLRPPFVDERGAGLWLCNVKASGMSIDPRSPTGTVFRAWFT